MKVHRFLAPHRNAVCANFLDLAWKAVVPLRRQHACQIIFPHGLVSGSVCVLRCHCRRPSRRSHCIRKLEHTIPIECRVIILAVKASKEPMVLERPCFEASSPANLISTARRTQQNLNQTRRDPGEPRGLLKPLTPGNRVGRRSGEPAGESKILGNVREAFG